MAYDEKYRKRAIAYKEAGHTFKELKEVFGIGANTYYDWKTLLETTGTLKYTPPTSRKRKIDNEALKRAIAEKPDSYLRELAEIFDCSLQAIDKKLKKLGITLKKRRSPIPKNQRRSADPIWSELAKSPSENVSMSTKALLINLFSANAAERHAE